MYFIKATTNNRNLLGYGLFSLLPSFLSCCCQLLLASVFACTAYSWSFSLTFLIRHHSVSSQTKPTKFCPWIMRSYLLWYTLLGSGVKLYNEKGIHLPFSICLPLRSFFPLAHQEKKQRNFSISFQFSSSYEIWSCNCKRSVEKKTNSVCCLCGAFDLIRSLESVVFTAIFIFFCCCRTVFPLPPWVATSRQYFRSYLR